MTNALRTSVVGVFQNRETAERAVHSLTEAGFPRNRIGIAMRNVTGTEHAVEGAAESPEAKGAITGAAAGLGLGALAGVGVLSGVIPVIGPAIAAGTLGVMLSNAAAGAGIVGVVGALIGAGVPDDEAHFYQTEFEAGRLIMTVDAGARTEAAIAILRAHGAYDIQSAGEAEGWSQPSGQSTIKHTIA